MKLLHRLCLLPPEERTPELLFPSDPDLAARVRRHPALVWKAQNARDFTAGRRRPPRPWQGSRRRGAAGGGEAGGRGGVRGELLEGVGEGGG